MLSSIEFSDLVAAAAASVQMFRGLSGVDRSIIYILAAYTGLRASEIGSLRSDSFDFNQRTVTVEMGYTKNSELAILPLRSDLAVRLKNYLASRTRTVLSFDQESELV